jgi:hypothetical protein
MIPKHNIPQKGSRIKRFAKKLLVVTGLSVPAVGCVTGGSAGVAVDFGNQAMPSETVGLEYDSATGTSVRGTVRTKSGLEVEASHKTFGTSGSEGIVNEDVDVTETGVNVTYPFLKNGKAEVYAGAGVAQTSQKMNQTLTGFPGSGSEDSEETSGSGILGARTNVGPCRADGRVTVGKRGATVGVAFEYRF